MPAHDDYYDGEHNVPLLPGVGKGQRHDVDIEVHGPMGRVTVGGQQVKGVRGLTYRAGLDEVASLTLDLKIIDVTRLGSKDTEILLPDETVNTLIALGWAPPQVTGGDQTPGG